MTERNKENICIGLLAAALPFTHLLDVGYRLPSFEVWSVSALYFLLGASLSNLLSRFSLQPIVAATTLFAFGCVYFVNAAKLSTPVLFVLFFLILILLIRMGKSLIPVAAVFAVVFSLSNALVPGKQNFARLEEPAKSLKPKPAPQNALLHIILDEQASLASLASTIPANHSALSIYDDYKKRGFKLYPTVRSSNPLTRHSLTELVSLRNDKENLAEHGTKDSHTFAAKRNEMFERLQTEGYHLHVFQSEYLDFCAGDNLIKCNTYPMWNMDVFERSGLNLSDRFVTALDFVSNEYMNPESGRYFGAYGKLAGNLVAKRNGYKISPWPLKSFEVMEQLKIELENLEPGDVFFAHLLVPHYPYLMRADCKVKAPSKWASPIRTQNNLPSKQIEAAYWDQVACVHKKILQILDVIADKPFTTVMIHGDHGARLYYGTVQENEKDNLDTFFAVQNPNGQYFLNETKPFLSNVFAKEFEAFLKGREFEEALVPTN
ncbi:MAG: hypothetical protein AAGF53_01310 [Pseudomonadota bacterium]